MYENGTLKCKLNYKNVETALEKIGMTKSECSRKLGHTQSYLAVCKSKDSFLAYDEAQRLESMLHLAPADLYTYCDAHILDVEKREEAPKETVEETPAMPIEDNSREYFIDTAKFKSATMKAGYNKLSDFSTALGFSTAHYDTKIAGRFFKVPNYELLAILATLKVDRKELKYIPPLQKPQEKSIPTTYTDQDVKRVLQELWDTIDEQNAKINRLVTLCDAMNKKLSVLYSELTGGAEHGVV